MTYAEDLARNKYAQMALDIGWNHKLSAPEMHTLARHLGIEDDSGRARNAQHLIQIGVKFARTLKDGR